MRIGIDLDDTIFCTTERYDIYQKDYILKHNITKDELWSNAEYRHKFIKDNLEVIFEDIKLKSDCLDVLKKLKRKGHKIFIITARSNEYCGDAYKFTKNNIDRYDIPYDKLIITGKNKLNACIENKIDIMIDDSEYVINELKETINYLLFDDKNQFPNFENRVNNWEEIYEKIGGD